MPHWPRTDGANALSTPPATEAGFYVSVRNGDQSGLLLGPYAEHAHAEANVDRARDEALAVDPWAHFYEYGTCRVEAATLPQGRLNARIYLYPCAMCIAGVTHDTCDHGNRVRVGLDFGEETADAEGGA